MLTLLLHNVDRETFHPHNIVFSLSLSLYLSIFVFDVELR